MTEREQIIYLASWLHSYRCRRAPTHRGAAITPDHSWTTCPRMRRFWWAVQRGEGEGSAPK